MSAIIDAYLSGKSVRQISRETGMDRRKITQILRIGGIRVSPIAPIHASAELIARYSQGQSLRQIQRETGILRQVLCRRLKRAGIPIDLNNGKLDLDVAEVRMLALRGHSQNAIARMMGCTARPISRILKLMYDKNGAFKPISEAEEKEYNRQAQAKEKKTVKRCYSWKIW